MRLEEVVVLIFGCFLHLLYLLLLRLHHPLYVSHLFFRDRHTDLGGWRCCGLTLTVNVPEGDWSRRVINGVLEILLLRRLSREAEGFLFEC